MAYQYSLQQFSGSLVVSRPQRDEVPRQLTLHQHPVVVALDEERLDQVDGHRPLGQRQHLHLLPRVRTTLLYDGFHEEASTLLWKTDCYE